MLWSDDWSFNFPFDMNSLSVIKNKPEDVNKISNQNGPIILNITLTFDEQQCENVSFCSLSLKC